MKKTLKTLLLVMCVVLLTGCGAVKLDNGENAIVSFDEGGISSGDLYKVLKETYGAENIVNLIDKFLLDKKYKVSADETKYINQAIKTAKETATQYNTTLDTYVYYYYGVANESAFRKYLSLQYKRSLWIEEYGKETVTDKQVEEYYENEYVGDMTLSHILITSTATDKMTDEEKATAKTEALNKAKDIITKLQNKEDFAELAKNFSKDEETASNGGSLGKVNTGDYDDVIIEAAKSLEVGTFSTTPVESSYGYHVIYKTAQDDKPELDDTVKEEIRTIVGKEISAETSFYLTAMKALREKNGMKFEDAELERSYEDYLTKNTQTN